MINRFNRYKLDVQSDSSKQSFGKTSKITQFWVVDIDNINEFFGDLDLFLLDWILKGNLAKGDKILDAGSGVGRNLTYFLHENYDVQAIDKNKKDVDLLNFIAKGSYGRAFAREGDLEKVDFSDDEFDFILCSRVLHFAEDEQSFEHMLNELMRVLKPSGVLYLSMASNIGQGLGGKKLDNGKIMFPDGAVRFVLTRTLLRKLEMHWSHKTDPRTVIFGNKHEETTLILKPNRS